MNLNLITDHYFGCFANRIINRKIDRLHEKTLRLVYKDYACNFHELLGKDKSVTIHKRNLRALVIEIYKIYHRNIQKSFYKVPNINILFSEEKALDG